MDARPGQQRRPRRFESLAPTVASTATREVVLDIHRRVVLGSSPEGASASGYQPRGSVRPSGSSRPLRSATSEPLSARTSWPFPQLQSVSAASSRTPVRSTPNQVPLAAVSWSRTAVAASGRCDRGPVERDRHVQGVDDGMAQCAGCAAARRLPRVQFRRSELVEEVGDGQRSVPRGHGVGEHGEVAAGRRHLGAELLGSQPRRHRHVRDHMAYQPLLAQRRGVPSRRRPRRREDRRARRRSAPPRTAGRSRSVSLHEVGEVLLELVEGGEEAGAGLGHAHRLGHVPLMDDDCGSCRRRGRRACWWCASRSPARPRRAVRAGRPR